MSLPSYTRVYHTTPYDSISPVLPALSTKGKSVLITGAGSGIGRSIALSFAASSPRAIILLGRTEASLLSVKKEIESKYPGPTVLTFVADITDQAAVDKAFASTMEKLGDVDILIQNAGYMPIPEPISTSSIAEYFSGLEINLKGNLILTQAFLKSTDGEEEEKGKADRVIIHLTTAGVHLPAMPLPVSAYVVSKIAAVKMMEYLSVELKEKGVRVVSVHPGVQDTTMAERGGSVGLVMPFDDVELAGNFMVWVASPEAEFLNGKLVWANWDVEELKASKEKIMAGPALTIGLNGWN